MMGAWKVLSNSINGKRMYIIGRVLDETKPMHGGNVEYHGGYVEESQKEAAEETAIAMNSKGNS